MIPPLIGYCKKCKHEIRKYYDPPSSINGELYRCDPYGCNCICYKFGMVSSKLQLLVFKKNEINLCKL